MIFAQSRLAARYFCDLFKEVAVTGKEKAQPCSKALQRQTPPEEFLRAGYGI